MADRMFIKIFCGRNYENEVWMELHLGFKLQISSFCSFVFIERVIFITNRSKLTIISTKVG